MAHLWYSPLAQEHCNIGSRKNVRARERIVSPACDRISWWLTWLGLGSINKTVASRYNWVALVYGSPGKQMCKTIARLHLPDCLCCLLVLASTLLWALMSPSFTLIRIQIFWPSKVNWKPQLSPDPLDLQCHFGSPASSLTHWITTRFLISPATENHCWFDLSHGT